MANVTIQNLRSSCQLSIGLYFLRALYNMYTNEIIEHFDQRCGALNLTYFVWADCMDPLIHAIRHYIVTVLRSNKFINNQLVQSGIVLVNIVSFNKWLGATDSRFKILMIKSWNTYIFNPIKYVCGAISWLSPAPVSESEETYNNIMIAAHTGCSKKFGLAVHFWILLTVLKQ